MNFFNFTLFFTFSFFSLVVSAFIPKPATILSKTAENGGNGVYLIEQEVSFPISLAGLSDPFVLKEQWIVAGPDKMKLIVSGTKELKDKIRWVFLYENNHRFQVIGQNRQQKQLNHDFIEKYFHFRKPADLQHSLIETKAAPASLFAKKPHKLGKEADVVNDPALQLARVGGTISYAFRELGEEGQESPAAFFIEQDLFVLRKFRIGNLEVNADKFSSFARGLMFPRNRIVKWNENIVNIATLQVSPRTEKTAAFNLENSTSFDFTDQTALKNIVEEFYKRFR